jgi:hypothetical protein
MKKQWISIKCGLSRDPKHRRAMANSIWLFMHMLDLADWETGTIELWRDEAEAEEMGMELRTLREQRRELDKQGYITCIQKQHGQKIIIHNWTNPREYSGETYNKKQGDNKVSPSQGYTQGYIQGSKKNVTPTSCSNIKESSLSAAVFDFSSMSVEEAHKVPTLAMYAKAAEFFPGCFVWQVVHEFITEHNLTEEQIRTAALAWSLRGYRRDNIEGILQWARDGVPTKGAKNANSNSKSGGAKRAEQPRPAQANYSDADRKAAERVKQRRAEAGVP